MKMSRSLSIPLFFAVVWSISLTSVGASDYSVFGPKDCAIGDWHLYFSRHVFTVDESGDGLIVVRKNTPDRIIDGGFLFFNWRLIPLRNFLSGENLIAYRDTQLRARNRLAVLLRGDPGASVSIEIRKLDTPVPLPEITLLADPMSLVPGESAMVSWETAYADIAILDHDIGEVPLSGSILVTPEADTTYVLAAIGPGGSTTDSVTIAVAPSPPTADISVVPPSIYAGETATLAWASSNADTCAIEPDIGVVPLEGSVEITPAETTTYTIIATGSGGMATAETTVTVSPALPVVEIRADPMSIHVGESSLLTWNATHVETCRIEPDVGPVSLSGSIPVNPAETTVYAIYGDGAGGTAEATVTVTVVNSPPVADEQTVTTDEDIPVTMTLTGSDADGDPLEYTVRSEPDHGVLSGTPPELTYLPHAHVYGTDTFTFVVNDGQVDSLPAMVTIVVGAVNDPPVAQDDRFSTQEDIPITTNSVLQNDTDIDDDLLTVSDFTQPDHGTVTQPENGIFIYVPDPNFHGSDGFMYTVSDSQSAADTAQVTLAVSAVNDVPTADAGPDQEIVAGDTVTLDGTGSSDVDGDSLIFGWSFLAMPPESEAVLSDTSAVAPTFLADVPGEYILQLIVDDGTAESLSDTVVVTATPAMVAIPDVTGMIQTTAETTIVGADLTVGIITQEHSDTILPDHVISQYPAAGSSVETGTPVDLAISLGPESTTPTVTISIDPVAVLPGDSATLTWTVSNAHTAVISPDVGTVPTSGSIDVAPQHTTTYEITAIGATGCANACVRVPVLGNPQLPPEGSFAARYDDLVPPDATVAAYAPQRFSLVTGQVKDSDGQAIEGAVATLLNHPEYGTAETDENGRFSLPVEGGETLVVRYEKEGFLPVQRKAHTPWNDIAVVDPVVMIPPDPASTTVTFDNDPANVVTHKSTFVTDGFGSRSCTMVLTGDNRAFLVDKAGDTIRQLDTITLRATEYPSPDSMPALLPATSAFTYCVELQADGVTRLRFEKPVAVWVDNFLGFEVGDVVPVGWYDRDRGDWVAEENGVVVELLDRDGDGVVDALDADGDGQPDDIDGDGDVTREVLGLDDGPYSPGDRFWRITTGHFSPFDLNWPASPPADATMPTADGVVVVAQQEETDCANPCGSYAEARSRILHQDIPVPGTDMTLHYASNRVQGYRRKITVPASGDTVPDSLSAIVVKINLAGRTLRQILPAMPNQVAEFSWNGLDYLDRQVTGSVRAHVTRSFVYDYVYLSSGAGQWAGGKAFGQMGIGMDSTGIVARQSQEMSETSSVLIHVPVGEIANGWTLSPHHRLSTLDLSTVHKGDGGFFQGSTLIVDTVVGDHTNGCDGDGGPAIEARIQGVREMATGADGSLYLADSACDRVRRVDPEGIITTVAGGGSESPDNGGLAVDADLTPTAVAVGEGYLFVATTNAVYRIDDGGSISRFAGTGSSGFSGDNGPATAAQFAYIQGIALDDAGNLYIADKINYRIRRVGSDGVITTVAGNGVAGYTGEGGPAADAGIGRPDDVATGPDGSIYIAASMRIFKVGPDGKIHTLLSGYSPKGLTVDESGNLFFEYGYRVYRLTPKGVLAEIAGTGNRCYVNELPCGDGGPAAHGLINSAWDIALGPDGSLYIADGSQYSVRKIAPPISFFRIWSAGDIAVAESPSLGYVMSPGGRHKKTVDLNTGNVLHRFVYDNDDRLVTIIDRFSNETTIERDMDGTPSAIISYGGIVTTLGLDEDMNLVQVAYPDGHAYQFEYMPGALMTAKIEPEGNYFEYVFDAFGRLSHITDEEGGHWQYARSSDQSGEILSQLLTGEGNTTTYLDRTDPAGVYMSTITSPTGAETAFVRSADGLSVGKTLPCGMELEFAYDLDEIYTSRYLKRQTVRAPSGMERVVTKSRENEDTNMDQVPDVITEKIGVNGKETTLVQDVLQSQRTITSPEARSVTVSYDPATLLPTTVAVADLYPMTYTHDNSGRLTAVTVNGRETAYTYSAQGFLSAVTDPEGHTTYYDRDAVGRVTSILRPDGGALHFAYDGNGNVTVLTNPLSVDHTFEYNTVNRWQAYVTPLSGAYGYAYDKDRRLIRTDFPSGKQIANVYADGRLIQVRTPEGNIDFSYLCDSMIGSVSSGSTTVTYTYDGRLVTSESTSGGLNQTVSCTYDNDFNLSALSYAGATETYTRDDDGLLTGAGRFTVLRSSGNGLPESITDGTMDLSRGFNGYGEVELEQIDVGGTTCAEWQISRDHAGRIAQRTEINGGLQTDEIFTYDAAGRLLTVTRDGVATEEYQYDQNGTRIYEVNIPRGISGRTFTYSEEDHLLSTDGTTYDYDLDGFLTTRTTAGDITSYDYSARGELLSVTLPDGVVVSYTYDPLGRRIAKAVDGTITERYLWQGLTRLLAVYNGTEDLLMRFEYADDRMPPAMTRNGQTFYLAYDAAGSLKAIIDDGGNIVKRIRYDAFGNVIEDTNPSFQIPFGFAGGLRDPHTGLLHFGYRDYDPDTARWTAKDPILFAAGDTDLYGYCLNDPVNLVDPEGNIGIAGVVVGSISGAYVGFLSGVQSGSIVKGLAAGALGGFAGGVVGSFFPHLSAPVASMIGGTFGGAVGGASAKALSDPCVTTKDLVWAGMKGGSIGGATGVIGGGVVAGAAAVGATGLVPHVGSAMITAPISWGLEMEW